MSIHACQKDFAAPVPPFLLDTNGDLLIETGKAEGKNEKGELKYAFRYVVVWKKENGLWKLYRDV